MLLDFTENGLQVVIDKDEATGTLYLRHCSAAAFTGDESLGEGFRKSCRLVEVHRSGENRGVHRGGKQLGTNPGGPVGAPQYERHEDTRNALGRQITLVQGAGDLEICTLLQFFDGVPVLRSETVLRNRGSQDIPIEFLSSFALHGLCKGSATPWGACGRVHIAYNSWMEELQWRSYSMSDLGMTQMSPARFSMQRILASNTGSFSSKEKSPLGCFENSETGECYAWQIEHHGSWSWEIGEHGGQLYLRASGPSEAENQWFKQLAPGEVFRSVPAAVAVVSGGPDEAFRALNRYRRRIRRDNPDNRHLPVIFNDYMNCLNADPTTEKVMPLIDRAAALGVEYYVMDAGWYADGAWWDSVGEWLPSAKRFPGGLQQVLDHMVTKGLKPGLWLELERMGMNCPLVKQWPDECFFCRHGRRVIERSSLQLDFRSDIVRRHANAVVDRLVGDMGVRFIKMDYNFDIGVGTDIAADSFGDGLLQHQRAYMSWLDEVLARYPDLVIENCSSGGMRNSYSLLSRLSICSTTDNTNYLRNALISINSATTFCMEQAGVWAYPLATATDEEVVMNMVSALCWRPYVSGQIWALAEDKLALMREAIALYKTTLRAIIPAADPYWPLGLVSNGDAWSAFMLRSADRVVLAVWHFNGGPAEMDIPLPGGALRELRCVYPTTLPCDWRFTADGEAIHVALPEKSARLFMGRCG